MKQRKTDLIYSTLGSVWNRAVKTLGIYKVLISLLLPSLPSPLFVSLTFSPTERADLD